MVKLQTCWGKLISPQQVTETLDFFAASPPQPIPESALLTGELESTNDAYAIAKIAGIHACKAYRKQYGANFIAVLPTNLYGPNDNFHPEHSHVLPALLRRFQEAKQKGRPEVIIWGSGTPRREFLHSDDLADACLFLMDLYESEEIINVGWGIDQTIKELAEFIAEVIGFDGKLIWDASRQDGTPQKVLDCGKINSLGWKPKIQLVARDYHKLIMKLNADELDSLNNITLHPMMKPIPDDKKIPYLGKTTIESRAESFFVKGSVFYYLSIINDYFSAERIIIKSKKVILDRTGFIVLRINEVDYSPERSYVPQLGKYENLSYIMDDYFPEPVFGPSGLPQYLDENLLQPSIIFGTVFDAKTQNIVPGAEVSIAGTSKWRITDELGKYAFQVNKPGSYQVIVNPPFGYSSSQTGITKILVKSARGGWYNSNHYLNP